MRVISGKYARRAIESPEWAGVRPLLSRLRRAVFDTLMPYLPHGPFLDLFGGTGAFTLEALSRGAPSATTVELDPRTAKLIQSNLAHANVQEPVDLRHGDAVKVLQDLVNEGKRYNVIAIAPPYREGLENKILDILDANPQLLLPDGIAFVQYPTDDKSIITERNRLELWREKNYGQTIFTYYLPPEDVSSEDE